MIGDLSTLRQRINGVQFIGSANTIPSWNQRGIPHGFVGIEGELSGQFFGKQVHGIQLEEASDALSEASDQRPNCDGVWTNLSNQKVSIQTADCLPVLFSSSSKVAAVHGGWRGLFAGILRETHRLFAEETDTLVAIGPHISMHSFEVGPELLDELAQSGLDSRWFPYIVSKGLRIVGIWI